MQQDVELGIVQIVDIALRAISPAINDPTTAISSVDQLSSILIRWVSRAPPQGLYYDPPHALRVIVPWIGLDGLLDLAFEQIRHDSISDAAVSLRLMRALGDISSATSDAAVRKRLFERGTRVIDGCAGRIQEFDLARLRARLQRLEAALSEGARAAVSRGPRQTFSSARRPASASAAPPRLPRSAPWPP